jgi:hypothetical protein
LRRRSVFSHSRSFGEQFGGLDRVLVEVAPEPRPISSVDQRSRCGMRGADRVERIARLAPPVRPARQQPDPLDDRLVGIAPLSQPPAKIVDVIGGKSCPQPGFDDTLRSCIDTYRHCSPPRLLEARLWRVRFCYQQTMMARWS